MCVWGGGGLGGLFIVPSSTAGDIVNESLPKKKDGPKTEASKICSGLVKTSCHVSRRDRKIPEFLSLSSKPVLAGHHFSCKICFVPESLWPVKCTALSDFWTGQIAIKTIITRSSNPSQLLYTVST